MIVYIRKSSMYGENSITLADFVGDGKWSYRDNTLFFVFYRKKWYCVIIDLMKGVKIFKPMIPPKWEIKTFYKSYRIKKRIQSLPHPDEIPDILKENFPEELV